MNFNEKIIVGMSGGVDSSISAIILKDMGFNIKGLFMKNWEEDDHDGNCNAKNDYQDAKRIADKLGIELLTVNFSDKYWSLVFKRFIDGLNSGITPNPDIFCNREIKFHYFLNHVLSLEYDKLATGHYAKIKIKNDKYTLNIPKDKIKDQTYFLYVINQYIMDHLVFPLNDISKSDVKGIAKSFDIKLFEKKESMGICFIGKKNYTNLISNYITNIPGKIVDDDNKVLGKHNGLFYYTIGQRKGIGIGGTKNRSEKPWYVVDKKIEENYLVVSQDTDRLNYKGEIELNEINWINNHPEENKEYHARFRHGGKLLPVTIIKRDEKWYLDLKTSERAPTCGQSAVLYDEDECIGGGIINKLCF